MGEARKANPLRVFRMVLSGLFGVRRMSDHEHDAASVTPLQIIFAALVIAALFVLALLTLVHFITAP